MLPPDETGAPAPVAAPVVPVVAPLVDAAAVPPAALPAAAAPLAAAPAAPPETLIPDPPARSPFVVLKPLLGGEGVLAPAGCIVSLDAVLAAEWADLIRPAQIIDLSRWGKAPIAL